MGGSHSTETVKDKASARAKLLEGVTEIHKPGTPGPLCCFGEYSFPLIYGRYGKGDLKPVVAAAFCGNGKVVAYGHTGYTSPKSEGDNNRLLLNAIAWFREGQKDPGKIAVYHDENRALMDFLNKSNLEAVKLSDIADMDDRDFSVLIACSHSLNGWDSCDELDEFFAEGGCAIITGVGWGWLQKHKHSSLRDDHPGNILLSPFGITWMDGTVKITGSMGFKSDITPDSLESHDAGYSLREAFKYATLFDDDDDPYKAHTDILLKDVKEIHLPGIPGPLCVFGENAFPVMLGQVSRDILAPVVAAATLGSGRVVAYGHTGYLQPQKAKDVQQLEKGGNGQLLKNIFEWFGEGGRQTLKVAVYQEKQATVDYLKSLGIRADLVKSLEDFAAGGYNVLCCSCHGIDTETEVSGMTDFLLNGGRALLTGTGWGWIQCHRGKDLRVDYPGNALLSPFGICWTDGYLSKTGKTGFRVHSKRRHPYTHVMEAIRILQDPSVHTEKTKKGACSLLCKAVSSLPANDCLVMPALKDLGKDNPGSHKVPSDTDPVNANDHLARVALTREILEAENDDKCSGEVCQRASQIFPGIVPKSAPRSKQAKLWIECDQRGWHSTGYYAPPGEKITVRIVTEAAVPTIVKLDYYIQIGSQTDILWDKEDWLRAPKITMHRPMTQSTVIANPFGGLIYVDVPSKPGVEKFEIDITGAVEAPWFILGTTKNTDRWQDKPAPWAELQTKKLIITLPVQYIAAIDDVEKLLLQWNKILDAMADLCAIDRNRPRPERMVVDVQLSAGYMHAGYPIMIHNDEAVPNMLNLDKVCGGEKLWGHYHELGHNHQSDHWTFDGTTEVTVNIFTMYIIDTLCQMDLNDCRKEVSLEGMVKPTTDHIKAGAPYVQWKSSPFLALIMFRQLQHEFGWDSYKKFFAEYHQKGVKLPKNDQEKRDQWLTRFSKIVNRNLGPFFDAWGVPVSKEAKAEVADLDPWLPEVVKKLVN